MIIHCINNREEPFRRGKAYFYSCMDFMLREYIRFNRDFKCYSKKVQCPKYPVAGTCITSVRWRAWSILSWFSILAFVRASTEGLLHSSKVCKLFMKFALWSPLKFHNRIFIYMTSCALDLPLGFRDISRFTIGTLMVAFSTSKVCLQFIVGM